MNTPKERFIASPHAANFAKAANTEAFEAACDYALMQLCSELPVNCQPGMANDYLIGYDANGQRTGATRVLEILKHLHEAPKAPTPTKTPALHY